MSTTPYVLTGQWSSSNRFGPASGDTDINVSNTHPSLTMGWAITAGTTAPTITAEQAHPILPYCDKGMTLLDGTYLWLIAKSSDGAATIEA